MLRRKGATSTIQLLQYAYADNSDRAKRPVRMTEKLQSWFLMKRQRVDPMFYQVTALIYARRLRVLFFKTNCC